MVFAVFSSNPRDKKLGVDPFRQRLGASLSCRTTAAGTRLSSATATLHPQRIRAARSDDRGVRVLAATSDGELIENPRLAERHRARVELHAVALDAATMKDVAGRCRNRRDPARIAAPRRLARAKDRANARRDWLRKVSRKIVDSYDFIALEGLAVRNMTRSARGSVEAPSTNVAAKTGLNRAILDAGFGLLDTLIREKAEYAARIVARVDPRYTSQTCAECGQR